MSHIVTIETKITDLIALKSACRRQKLNQPVWKQVQLFNDTVTGYSVRLPNWKYPVVCDLENRQIRFDNYQGKWGDQQHLDRLIQIYAVEKSKIECRKRGHSLTEQTLANGSIKLTVQVGATQ